MPRLLRSAALAALGLTLLTPALAKAPPDWRLILRQRPRDHDRLRDWRLTFTTALDQARAAGQGDKLAHEGALLQPDAAVDPPDAPPGDYRCRTIRLGAVAPGANAYVPNPWNRRNGQPLTIPAGTPTLVELPPVPCRVTADGLVVQGGAQRPAGRLWPWDGPRKLFLGAVAVGDEGGALPYGRDPDRNLVGLFERVGPARWRLLVPKPSWGGQIEIVEFVPA